MKKFQVTAMDDLGVGVWTDLCEICLWEIMEMNNPGLCNDWGRKMIGSLEIGEYCSGPAEKQEGSRIFRCTCEIQRIA